MRKVDLDDLPKWSEWSTRLLGLRPWQIPRRHHGKVLDEYNGSKYAHLRDLIAARNKTNPIGVRWLELRNVIGYKSELCFSDQGDLCVGSLERAWDISDTLLLDTMKPYMSRCNTVLELGCGWGYNLWRLASQKPCKRYIGGDLCDNAVWIANKLNIGPAVCQYDMLDPQGPSLPGEPEPPVVVFTFQAVEQLPSCAVLIDKLLAVRDKISAVVHIEPDIAAQDWTSLLGQLRRRYIQVNDYNRDLHQQLELRADDIEILEFRPNVFGYNPLNPLSVIIWRPK